MRAPLLLCAIVLAGCAGGDHAMLDTGEIPPGGSAALVFAEEGDVEIHCHPHPFMEQTVRVVAGAPADAHVHILDGAAVEAYAFDPPMLEVAAGSNVTYHNHGTLEHTATQTAHASH